MITEEDLSKDNWNPKVIVFKPKEKFKPDPDVIIYRDPDYIYKIDTCIDCGKKEKMSILNYPNGGWRCDPCFFKAFSWL